MSTITSLEFGQVTCYCGSRWSPQNEPKRSRRLSWQLWWRQHGGPWRLCYRTKHTDNEGYRLLGPPLPN